MFNNINFDDDPIVPAKADGSVDLVRFSLQSRFELYKLSYINRHNKRRGHYCFPGVDIAVQREAPSDIPEKYLVQLKFENLIFSPKGNSQSEELNSQIQQGFHQRSQ